MKKILIIVTFLYLFIISYSQSYNQEVFDFLSNDKNRIFSNLNGYYFIEIPKEKLYKNRLSGNIVLNDTSNLNFSKINVHFSMNNYNYYLVSNMNIILVLKSINHIKKEMNLYE